MNEKAYTILIHKQLSGDISAEEALQLTAWRKNPKNERIFQELKTVWEHAKDSSPIIAENTLEIDRITLQARIQESSRQERKISRIKRNFQASMVIVAILIVNLAFLAYIYTRNTEEPNFTVQRSEGSYQTYLPDSSEVILNKNSRLSFSQNNNTRETTITGEAIFHVKHNAARPFLVHANDAVIKVTGTSFLVKAYPQEPLSVVLISGQVSVSHQKQTILLKKEGDMALLDQKLTLTVNKDPNVNSWHTGVYRFDQTPLQDILEQWEHNYEVSFSVDDPSLLDSKFSGIFHQQETLNTMLNLIAHSLDLTIQQHDRKYTIKKTGLDSPPGH